MDMCAVHDNDTLVNNNYHTVLSFSSMIAPLSFKYLNDESGSPRLEKVPVLQLMEPGMLIAHHVMVRHSWCSVAKCYPISSICLFCYTILEMCSNFMLYIQIHVNIIIQVELKSSKIKSAQP